MKYAAVTPLDLGTRIEFVVSFFSTNWNDLVGLLESPIEYLRAQQYLWKQDAATSVNWQLLSPLNATIEWAGHSPATLNRFQALVGSFDEQAKLESNPQAPQFGPKGSFLVDFATYTNAIRITYVPPDPPRGRRYSAGYSEPTMVRAAYESFENASVHFDLTNSSERMRADFIVSLMESPTLMPDWLTEQARENPRRFQTTYHLVAGDEGSPAPLPPGVPSEDRLSPIFEPEEDPGVGGQVKYPKIVVNNLSSVEPGAACARVGTIWNSDESLYNVVEIHVEYYLRQRYDPGTFIDQHMQGRRT